MKNISNDNKRDSVEQQPMHWILPCPCLKKHFRIGLVFLWIFVFFPMNYCQATDTIKIIPQSSHGGDIKELIIVYTKTAEVGIISLIDIIKALPDVEITVVSQFAPGSKEFGIFVSRLTQDSLGFNADGQRRLHFIQNDRVYGPWPRDQVLIDQSGRMWISSREQHQLRETILALAESENYKKTGMKIPFVGANILVCNNQVLLPGNEMNHPLRAHFDNPVIDIPAPETDQFHLDLLVMPLTDKIIAVGDMDMTRSVLLKLSAREQQRIIVKWAVEYAASANNVKLAWTGGDFIAKQENRPALILWQMLNEKLEILKRLLIPGAFRNAIDNEPDDGWDDQIAAALEQKGFKVIRIPFWPGRYGRWDGKKHSGLPMMCYPNCLVWDDGILMPVYGVKVLDHLAKSKLGQATGKKVFPISGGAILGYSYSGPHCLTVEFRK